MLFKLRVFQRYIINLVKSLMPIIFTGFSLINRKKKELFLFVSYPDFCDNSLTIFEYLRANRSSYNLKWLVDSKKDTAEYPFLKKEDIVKKNSIKGLWLFSCAKIVFHTHGVYGSLKPKKFPININLWHGMPLKCIGSLDGKKLSELPHTHYTIATSKYYAEVLSESFNIDQSKVWLTGLPRNDRLYSKSKKHVIKERIAERLSLQRGHRIIFWLPTYRVSSEGDVRIDSDSSSFLGEWTEPELYDINSKLANKNTYFIVKLHPMDSLQLSDIDWPYSHIKLINQDSWQKLNIGLYEALSASDGLMSDLSSVIIDYFVTNLPIGTTRKSLIGYNRSYLSKVDELLQSLSDVSSLNGIESFLKLTERSHAPIHDIFYSEALRDGLASERVICCVEKLLSEKIKNGEVS